MSIILLLIILVLYIIYYYYVTPEALTLKSDIDGQYYKVYHGGQETADTLAKINKQNLKFLDHLKENYSSYTSKRQADVDRLLERYNPDNIVETFNRPKKGGTTSFSLRKGVKLSLCLRGVDMIMHDFNTLMFVNVHELAHVSQNTVQHSTEYWRGFKWLLEQAVKAGIYKKVDYSKYPKCYCGMKLDSSPLYMKMD